MMRQRLWSEKSRLGLDEGLCLSVVIVACEG